jgi:hypothetical protein
LIDILGIKVAWYPKVIDVVKRRVHAATIKIFDFILTSRFNNSLKCLRPLKKAPFCPIPASGSNFNPQNTQCIPVVKIFAFLGLEQN